MRYPLFSKHANVSVDRPFLRKKLRYLEIEVCENRAYWVDVDDHSRGVICTELINFGPAPVQTDEEAQSPWGGVIIFREPMSAKLGRLNSQVNMVRKLQVCAS